MTIVYAITCPKCETTVFSRTRYDFRSCPCGSVAIDGGLDYTKVNFNPDIPAPRPFGLKVKQTRAELRYDWNHYEDKYGIIREKIPMESIVPLKKTSLATEVTDVETLNEVDEVEGLTVGKLKIILSKIKDKDTPVYFSTNSGYISEQVDVNFQLGDELVPFQDNITKNCVMISAINI